MTQGLAALPSHAGTMLQTLFPFPAIVGQERLKQALILNSINPAIGGVLICGEKGTAKSTTVRALSELLPGTRMVTLPLNATEDRVSGGIDFTRAVKKGENSLQEGLLAQADKGILYIDEVNLLDDHIVDIILDAAASGVNCIEREGFSHSHAARFLLVGTMNPEEGQLRPQFLDRFGLCIEVAAESDIENRILLMERKELFDADPSGFSAAFQEECIRIADKIDLAKKELPKVRLSDSMRDVIAQLCLEHRVAGHRADLVIQQAAVALSAYHGRAEAGIEEINQVAPMVLIHRERDPVPPPAQHPPELKKDPPDPPDADNDTPEEQPHSELEGNQAPQEMPENGPQNHGAKPENSRQRAMEKIFEVGETFKVRKFTAPKDRLFRRGSGRRSRSRTDARQGRYVKSTQARENRDIALDATLRAAAPFQIHRRDEATKLAVILKREDFREKVREKRIGNFLIFCVDASASMGVRGRMEASKSAIMSLLLDAYQKRDKVAMVTFRKEEAFVNLPPTTSVDLAGRLLEEMPVGGRTPLSSGLVKTFELLNNHLLREPSAKPLAIIITDGRGNISLGPEKPFEESLKLAEQMAVEDRIQYIVIDSESPGRLNFGMAETLANRLGGRYFKIADLKADQLIGIAKGELQ